ncbi:2-dehydro-3-deoxygalactonokinase [Roseicyclus persicicus]|uniref:2-dehydro-3-deoxygalactonokinase n=1 Tax=Roseicyclus persicicus TaxID=2650661 RepID=A0A7X6GZZ7_9RHOB|nr:2-dehydro-3-deoxygalactonokinase [Roseibacterium persicicum]NKX45497.1 2-dehydro-3-deoxygalactonokinase [Roseibacterium persicicum]
MSGQAAYADWIAVDWGTTHLRAWAMGPDGTVRASAQSEDGMGRLARDGFEPALLDLIQDWLGAGPTPILACGMVGAKQGWQEAPYVRVPAKPAELAPMRATAPRDPRLRLSIVPGLSQAAPPDVMRGEETQVAGFLAREPGFDGVLCLPGTHTKWVQLSAGEVVSFQTCMTGELFDLLSHHSVLRHSVDAPALDPAAFLEALADTLSRPERLAQRLFAVRADATLNGTGATVSRARLSGTLIGAELAATRPYWLGQQVAVAAAPALADLYARALQAQGVPARSLDAGPLTLAGLARIRAAQTEPSLP